MELNAHESNYILHTESLARGSQVITYTNEYLIDELGNYIVDHAGNRIVATFKNLWDTIILSADGPLWELRG